MMVLHRYDSRLNSRNLACGRGFFMRSTNTGILPHVIYDEDESNAGESWPSSRQGFLHQWANHGKKVGGMGDRQNRVCPQAMELMGWVD